MDAKDLDRYRQLLLAKRREIEAGAIGTIGGAGGATERPADVIDQATDAAQVDLQVHLHQTDSHLLRAIEEALARIDRQAFGVCRFTPPRCEFQSAPHRTTAESDRSRIR